MATEIEATKWLDYFGAKWIDQGRLDTETVSKVKLIESSRALCVTEQAFRNHSGASIRREQPVGCFHREVLVYIIVKGAREDQRNVTAHNLGS